MRVESIRVVTNKKKIKNRINHKKSSSAFFFFERNDIKKNSQIFSFGARHSTRQPCAVFFSLFCGFLRTRGQPDSTSAAALTSSSSTAAESLDGPRTWLPFAAWLSLLVGIAAAVSAWWGVSLRLEEYR